MKHLEHFALLNDQHGAGRNRGSRPHTDGLTCQTPFAKEVARSQHRDDGLFAAFTNHGEPDTAFLYVHYALSSITLRVDDLRSFELSNFSRHPGRIEKGLEIKPLSFPRNILRFFVAAIHDCFHTSAREHVLVFLRPQEIYCQRFLLGSLILFGQCFLPDLLFNFLSNNLQRHGQAKNHTDHTDVVQNPGAIAYATKPKWEAQTGYHRNSQGP